MKLVSRVVLAGRRALLRKLSHVLRRAFHRDLGQVVVEVDRNYERFFVLKAEHASLTVFGLVEGISLCGGLPGDAAEVEV